MTVQDHVDNINRYARLLGKPNVSEVSLQNAEMAYKSSYHTLHALGYEVWVNEAHTEFVAKRK